MEPFSANLEIREIGTQDICLQGICLNDIRAGSFDVFDDATELAGKILGKPRLKPLYFKMAQILSCM